MSVSKRNEVCVCAYAIIICCMHDCTCITYLFQFNFFFRPPKTATKKKRTIIVLISKQIVCHLLKHISYANKFRSFFLHTGTHFVCITLSLLYPTIVIQSKTYFSLNGIFFWKMENVQTISVSFGHIHTFISHLNRWLNVIKFNKSTKW